MKILTTLEELHSDERTAIAVGKFDGVHLGHRKLLKEILAAREQGLKAAVFTFEPSPEALFGMGDVRALTTREEKRRLLERLGVDLLIEYPMNFQTAAVEPEEFIREYLVRRLGAALIAAGEDLSYGNKGRGDFALLNSLKDICGFKTICVEKLCIDGEIVSSSGIRELIAKGNMEKAEKMLGRPYSVEGAVSHGRGLGHTIGFPTVNLYPSAEKALPPFGVYRSILFRDPQLSEYTVTGSEDIIAATDSVNGYAGKAGLPGITNIGVRPTVSAENRVSAETYLYDFDEDLYGECVCVELHHFQRPEQCFENVEALKAQLKKDIAKGKG